MDDWRLKRMHRTSAGDIRWDWCGDPGAQPVVLVHGTPFSSYIWRGVARALAAEYQVYVWDMPGYGASAKFEGQDLSLAVLGGVFAGLLEYWGLTEPLVVAHDSGGAVALGAHLLHGSRYRRLALVDAVALAPWGSGFFEVVSDHPEVFDRLAPALHRALLREYVNSASDPSPHPITLDALTEPWLGSDGQAAFYRQLAQRRADQGYTDEMQHQYGSVGMPVLVCWGESDTWVPVARGRELASVIPGAPFRGIPGAGHLLPEDKPAELTARLLTFMRNLAR